MNQTCLITGATDGIGKQTALELAHKNYSLVLIGRNLEKGESVVSELIRKTGNEFIQFHCADMSSMKAVKALAIKIQRSYDTIDILLNNAGAYFSQFKLTDDGIENTIALNHFAYFYFTELLLDMVKSDLCGRVINVASTAHKGAKLEFNDLQMENEYKGWTAYRRSKLMNIMFTYECHHRFSDSGVTFNCLHPGFVDSSFGNNNLGFAKNSIKIAKMLFAIDIVKGARTSVYLSSSDDVAGISGKYFDKCKVVQSSKASYIKEDQKKLWDATEELINSLQIN